jgi:isopenicillin N synthase-like dioxygenase
MFDSADGKPWTALQRLKANGFLTLSTRPRQAQAIRTSVDLARRFFQSSVDDKHASQLPEGCGYRPGGIEYSRSPAQPDAIESFTASIRTRAAARELRLVGAHTLHEALCGAIEELEPSANDLVIQLAAEVSGRSQARLSGMIRRWSCIQVNYARPPTSTQEFINELHEDGHLLTLACATSSGLELMIAGRRAHAITPSENKLVAMPGEIAWLLSGGAIDALHHRVRRDPSIPERLAFLYFCDLDPAFCEPWQLNQVNAGVDIGARVLTNASRFGLRGFCRE